MSAWSDSLTAAERINVRREIAVIRVQCRADKSEPQTLGPTDFFLEAIDCGHAPRGAAEVAKFKAARGIAESNRRRPENERVPVTSLNGFLDGLAQRLRDAASSERIVA